MAFNFRLVRGHEKFEIYFRQIYSNSGCIIQDWDIACYEICNRTFFYFNYTGVLVTFKYARNR